MIQMAEATREGKQIMSKDEDKLFIFVDGEKWDPPSETMTPNDIITQAAELDASTHYLVRTNRGREEYKDSGSTPITLKKADRYEVVSSGATTVS